MPILDKNGNPIAYHEIFPGDVEVNNIEFGAGRNNYGKIEYPNCYVTDLSYPAELKSYFQEYEDDNTDYHYLDNICDFYNTNFGRQFENIILCNPYGYGFYGLAAAKKFFDRAGEILIENGLIHILGKNNNKWSKKESFDKFIKNDVITVYQSKYDFKLESFETLDSEHDINVKYKFYTTGLLTETIPNERLIIKKL
ncbi:hypothetical protein RB619_05715 [Flavobacterium sp. LHD-80]|uniref:hypothetical protein n=1 Tax=Flavobacterium sp. LHD-80 TaxID=3071411 RepID=UPI0027E1A984|nr:hypothetical protein [Flavobacterium sp. LHD-80]MDQ6470132.1 hypothetical protein [Flavobacterium sp. LHD-80]